jgi:hypothetical protein
MYDPSQLLKPVKNGAAIGPVMYDPTDFTPRKHILLTWSPEMVQDILNIDTEQEQRQIIHNLLDDVLDNPEEYKTKGFRGILVRGLFEVIDNNDGSEVIKNDYDIDVTNQSPADVGYSGRLADILKKNKDVEDKMAKVEKYHDEVRKIMELKNTIK